jgi:hypothetical protein
MSARKWPAQPPPFEDRAGAGGGDWPVPAVAARAKGQTAGEVFRATVEIAENRRRFQGISDRAGSRSGGSSIVNAGEPVAMPEVTTKVITVFVAFRDGSEKGINLDRDTLVRDFKIREGSTRAHVRAFEGAVGVIEGELFKWWEVPDNHGGTKLHWVCPQCGLEQ